MGDPGSVAWQFFRLGIIRVHSSQFEVQRDELEMGLIEAGVDDIIESEFGVEIRCPVDNFQKVLETVQKFEIEPEDSGLEWVAKEDLSVDEGVSAKVGVLYDSLDELDDVKGVFTNEG